MLEHKKIQNLSDYFAALNNRQNKGEMVQQILDLQSYAKDMHNIEL